MQDEYSDAIGWHHYRRRGNVETVPVTDRNMVASEARIREEYVSTGKQRVHMGFRMVLELNHSMFCSGSHLNSLEALDDLSRQMQENGYQLHVWGLDPRYYQTGLSEGSGYGYISTGNKRDGGRVRMIASSQPVSHLIYNASDKRLPAQVDPRRLNVVLLGDSIFDNQNYVEQHQAVIDHLQRRLGSTGSARLLAVDGAVTRDVTRQLAHLPRDTTHVFLSAGGNDALGCMSVLDQPVDTVMQALALLTERQNGFARNYQVLATELVQLKLPVTVCTVYEDVPDLPAPLKTALSLFNDVIVRVAMRHSFGILDLREHLQSATDYSSSSPIEPSETGGEKIALAVAQAVGVAS